MWELSARETLCEYFIYIIMLIRLFTRCDSRYASDYGLEEDNKIKNKSEFPINSVALDVMPFNHPTICL